MKRRFSFAVLFFCAVSSIICAFFALKTRRYAFYFPRAQKNDSCAVEIRNLPKNSSRTKYAFFVDELLLGPQTDDFLPLFSYGTIAKFCFVRSSQMFVNLSSMALLENSPAVPINIGIELFKKNIKKNFSQIKTINLFIDGKFVEEFS